MTFLCFLLFYLLLKTIQTCFTLVFLSICCMFSLRVSTQRLPESVTHCLCCALDAVLTIQPNMMTFFIGESVTFTCDIKGGEYTDWTYRLFKDGQEFIPYYSNKHYTLILLYTSYGGEFQCCGLGHSTKCSKSVSISVSGKCSLLQKYDFLYDQQ